MATSPHSGQDPVQPDNSTVLSPPSSSLHGHSTTGTTIVPFPQGGLSFHQSFDLPSASVSSRYNVPNSWSQTQFLASSSSHFDMNTAQTQMPSLPVPHALSSVSTPTPYLKPTSFPTGYFRPDQSHPFSALSAPASSGGLSYASSTHYPLVHHPSTFSAQAAPVPSPSVPSIHPSLHPTSPPIIMSRPPSHSISPHAPVPLHPIPFDNLNRIISPVIRHTPTPEPPAPPYFQHNLSPRPLSARSLPSPVLTFYCPPQPPPFYPPSRPASLPPTPAHTPLHPFLHVRQLSSLPNTPPSRPRSLHSPIVLPPPHLPPVDPPPVRQPALSTYSKPDFPSLSSIPLLSSANDWSKWYSSVMQVIEATGLFDHIVDVLPTNYLLDPTAYPSFPPTIDIANYSQADLDRYKTWWAQDDIVSFILVGKLGPIPASLIPSKRDAWGNPQRIARDVLRILRTKYGVYDATSAAAVRDSVLSKKVVGGDVTSYVDMWRKAVLQVEGSHWDFSSYEKVQRFADGLPRTYEYEPLRVQIREGFNTHPPHGIISFYDASQAALNIELASRRLSNSHPATSRRSHPSPSTSSTTAPVPPASSDSTPSSTTATRPRCSNCGALGHVAGNCWEPGGGDVGGRDRYLAANPTRPRAHVATVPESSPLDPIIETSESSEIESASVPSSAYLDSEASDPPPLDTAFYLDFANAADPHVLASLADQYNVILDSGCTVHIIRDRKFFWTYDTSLAIPVGTANCGVLKTLARGETRFRVEIDGIYQIFCLKDCLHAPDVPINLLSVGSMTERDMCLVFEKDVTSIHFPDSLPHLSDHTINATVVRRLSFLHLDFVLPPGASSVPPPESLISFPAVELQESDLLFLRVDPSPSLWHRRFGHLGIDATRAVLTKSYATGVKVPTTLPLSRTEMTAFIVFVPLGLHALIPPILNSL
ncbi:hypothetical protein D9615_004993 [Tricholomella constricta]|uniref:CCHC-type domain-containing protein n=1 Tax=Tricholomella constricta TaxID=117010 RepID=A0A8H5M6Z8_9AGAR|nr:hypothetical protein D9615_004993 [Tricholomella constricta]